MGYIIEASCKCGFSQNVNCGRGFQSRGKNYQPAFCAKCDKLVSADFNDPKCLVCGTTPMFYNGTSEDAELMPLVELNEHRKTQSSFRAFHAIDASKNEPRNDTYYRCPKCNQRALRFGVAGMWD